MKRILLVSQNFYPEIGSGANRFKNLFKQFKAQGYDVYVLTAEPSYPNAKMYEDALYWDDAELNSESEDRIIRLHMRHEKQKDSMTARLSYYLEFMMKIHYFIKSSHHLFDTIYLTSPNIFVPWGGLFFQPDFKAEKVLEIRDLWPDSVVAVDKINIRPVLPILKLMEKRMYNKADKIIVNNKGFIHHIKRMTNKPILYIPNSMYEGEIVQQTRYPHFSVVYTGNIGFAQNYEQLKEIADQLEQKEIYFNVIPYGYHANDFRKYTESYQFVNVMPTMPRKECLTFISKHHLSLSILKENEVFLNVLPGKVVDSLCAHVPVVTNLGGYVNQMINEQQIGFAKEAATVEDMIDAILYFKTNNAVWKRHQYNTIKVAEEAFTWEKNIRKMIKFMR